MKAIGKSEKSFATLSYYYENEDMLRTCLTSGSSDDCVIFAQSNQSIH